MWFMKVDLRKLRTFVAVGRHGGFARAAADLGLTQSAVSVAVRRLEGELGVQLLDRTPRSVRPTAAGARLLPVATRPPAELDAALQQVRATGCRRYGERRVEQKRVRTGR